MAEESKVSEQAQTIVSSEIQIRKTARQYWYGIEAIAYRFLASVSLLVTLTFAPASINHFFNLHLTNYVDYLCILSLGLATTKVVWNCLSMLRNPRATVLPIDILLFMAVGGAWEYPVGSNKFLICTLGIGLVAIVTFLCERLIIESNINHAKRS
jgi:hypothetical protein